MMRTTNRRKTSRRRGAVKRWLSLGAVFALLAMFALPLAPASAANGDTNVTVSPASQVGIVGGSVTVTALVTVGIGSTDVPVEAAAVSFTVTGANATTASSTTNSSGQASITISGPNAGTSSVTASAGGITSDAATIDWLSTSAANFTLSPTTINAATGTEQSFTAKVTDDSGAAISGVDIDFQVAGANETAATHAGTTDDGGNVTFSYTGTNGGNDTVTAFTDLNHNTKLDTGELSTTATVHWAAPASVSISPTSLTTSTGSALALTATVLDADGHPLAGVEVTFSVTGANPGSKTVTTDADGEAVYSDPGTHAGTDTVNASVEGVSEHATATIQWVAGTASLAVAASSDTPDVNTEVTLTGTLTDTNGDPISGVTVYFDATGANTFSDSAVTDDKGVATVTYTGTAEGADGVQAYADLNSNATEDSGEPSGSTTVNWGGALALALAPASQNVQVGDSADVTVTLSDSKSDVSGVTVNIAVSGANTATDSVTTDDNGDATFSYAGAKTGADTINAYADLNGNGSQDEGEPSATATVNWTAAPAFAPAQPAAAKAGCTYFPATQHNMCAGFAAYWNNFGGLAIFGMPITEEFQENGHTVQYYERARFEWQPGAWPERYDVLLGLVGNEVTAGRSAEAPFQATTAKNSADCTFYAQTDHNLCAGFQAYWEKYGGLATYGFPISEEFQEVNPDTGKTYTVQYFERGRYEWHPGEWPERFDVMLGRLGSQVLSMKYGVSYK